MYIHFVSVFYEQYHEKIQASVSTVIATVEMLFPQNKASFSHPHPSSRSPRSHIPVTPLLPIPTSMLRSMWHHPRDGKEDQERRGTRPVDPPVL